MSWLSKRSTVDVVLLILATAFAVRWVTYGITSDDMFGFLMLLVPLWFLKMAYWVEGGE